MTMTWWEVLRDEDSGDEGKGPAAGASDRGGMVAGIGQGGGDETTLKNTAGQPWCLLLRGRAKKVLAVAVAATLVAAAATRAAPGLRGTRGPEASTVTENVVDSDDSIRTTAAAFLARKQAVAANHNRKKNRHRRRSDSSSSSSEEDEDSSEEYVIITAPTNLNQRPPLPPPAPPLPTLELCDLTVDVECITDEPTLYDSGSCDDLIPAVTLCEKRPSEFKFKYNGGDCSQEFTIQEADKYSCTDVEWTDANGLSGNGPPLDEPAFLKLTVMDDESEVYYEGTEEVGNVFDAVAYSGRFEANSKLYVYRSESDRTVMQEVNFHTSCAENLFLADRFGSIQVVEFTNIDGTFSMLLNATIDIILTNFGETPTTITTCTSSFSNPSGTITEDCLGDTGKGLVLQSITLDMSIIRQDYHAQVFMVLWETLGGNNICSAVGETFWTAGNPPLP